MNLLEILGIEAGTAITILAVICAVLVIAVISLTIFLSFAIKPITPTLFKTHSRKSYRMASVLSTP